MEALVPLIPYHVQIVVNARKLDYLPWIEFIDSDLCAVLGTNLRKDSLMFTAKKDQKPQLEVYALGQGVALVNGTEVTSWDGALPRQMFYYFMDHHLVTRDEIFRVFWPNLPVKEATNVFHVTKRKIGEQITRVVNDGGDYELTQYGAGFYTPNVHIERHYDVSEFETAINAAYTTDSEEELLVQYEKAIHLYQGDFLTSLEMPWVQRRRDQLRAKFVDALIGVGRVHKRHERHSNAISYYIRSLREVPLREDVHRDLMELYMKLGRREEAISQYKALSNLLDTRLKVAPSKETRDLYETIV
jgi:two-component SAPR family response regulator